MTIEKANEARKVALPPAALAARAAHLHHVDGRTNIEIADELGISRLRVPKLLDLARETGIVRIDIRPPAGFDAYRSSALRKLYSLSEALVTPSGAAPGAVGLLAARYVREVLNGGGKLGVAWGRAIAGLVDGLEAVGSVPPVDVVQLIGGTPTVAGALHASELLGRLSALTPGQIFALQAPMILPSEATAKGLRAEESVARTLAAIPTVDIAVVGIGAWEEGTSRVYSEFKPRDQRRGTVDHVAADLCGVFVDSRGHLTGQELSDRMISATADDFKAIPLTAGIAYGPEKVLAIDAALKSGLLNVIATDASTADALLQHAQVSD